MPKALLFPCGPGLRGGLLLQGAASPASLGFGLRGIPHTMGEVIPFCAGCRNRPRGTVQSSVKTSSCQWGWLFFLYMEEFALQNPNGSVGSSSLLSMKLLPMHSMSTKLRFISSVKSAKLDFVVWCLRFAVLLMSVSVRTQELV